MDSPEALFEKYALQNAVRYDGKANPGSVVGAALQAQPELKKDIKTLGKLAAQIVATVNAMSVDEQRAKLEAIAPELLERKEKEQKSIFEGLGWEHGTPLITGMPPEPSKYSHIGHAKAALVNYEMAKWGGGEFRLRFDDTNPALAQQEFYDIIQENFRWLGVEWTRLDIATDYMERFEDFAQQLIEQGHCFVDDTDADTTNKERYAGKPSANRSQEPAETMRRWQALKEGEVLRLKIDPAHKNTTMRDPTIYRVINKAHVRTGMKYSKWPTYDFETCIMDSLQGITFRIRSKEFELRTELHQHIQTLLGFTPTKYYEQARFELEGVETSGRVIREKIQSGEYLGWDDPRLATLVALRRRGFTPEAIKSFCLGMGITKNDSTLTWDDLYLHNRRVLNETAKRLFFVEDPVAITVSGLPQKTVHLSYFPTTKANERDFTVSEEILIAKSDADALVDGKLYRLMDAANFTKQGAAYAYAGDELSEYRAKGKGILHYLPAAHDSVNVEILMPDLTIRKGLGENRVRELTVGDHIQFERVGFCRLDSVEGNVHKFWFTHK